MFHTPRWSRPGSAISGIPAAEREGTMRAGGDSREALRDGRKLWVLGEGRVEDVTTHPATRAMVDEYVAWYDRHFDPEWQDILFAPGLSEGLGAPEGAAWAYVLPKTSADLIAMGRSFSKTIFLSAGNITHTPAYGHLIASGVLVAVQQQNASAEQIANAMACRKLIAETGRFLTFCGGRAPIGFPPRAGPADRAALKLVRETDAGIVISGRIGMHPSPAYAEDCYVAALHGIPIGQATPPL